MNRIKAVGFDLFNTLITVEPHALDDAEKRLIQSLISPVPSVPGYSPCGQRMFGTEIYPLHRVFSPDPPGRWIAMSQESPHGKS